MRQQRFSESVGNDPRRKDGVLPYLRGDPTIPGPGPWGEALRAFFGPLPLGGGGRPPAPA